MNNFIKNQAIFSMKRTIFTLEKEMEEYVSDIEYLRTSIELTNNEEHKAIFAKSIKERTGWVELHQSRLEDIRKALEQMESI